MVQDPDELQALKIKLAEMAKKYSKLSSKVAFVEDNIVELIGQSEAGIAATILAGNLIDDNVEIDEDDLEVLLVLCKHYGETQTVEEIEEAYRKKL